MTDDREVELEREVTPTVRVAGLLKGQISWTSDAFADMAEEELAEFEGPIFPGEDR
jgi:hypothetical protein